MEESDGRCFASENGFAATGPRSGPGVERQEWPNGRVVLEVFAPYEDELDIIQAVVSRLVELSINEGLHVSVFPVKQKAAHRAA